MTVHEDWEPLEHERIVINTSEIEGDLWRAVGDKDILTDGWYGVLHRPKAGESVCTKIGWVPNAEYSTDSDFILDVCDCGKKIPKEIIFLLEMDYCRENM